MALATRAKTLLHRMEAPITSPRVLAQPKYSLIIRFGLGVTLVGIPASAYALAGALPYAICYPHGNYVIRAFELFSQMFMFAFAPPVTMALIVAIVGATRALAFITTPRQLQIVFLADAAAALSALVLLLVSRWGHC